MNGETKCINFVYNIYTIQYYSASKRKEILKCDTTWVNLEDVMLVKPDSHKRRDVPFHSHVGSK